MMRNAAFLSGVFVLCACVLMLQVIETRVLSVLSHYYLAFFAVSMAMFGMTVGALIVYFNEDRFSSECLFADLAWISSAFALSILFSVFFLTTSILLPAADGLVISVLQWLKLLAGLLPSYILAGVAICLALTRSRYAIGLVYGADLAGAAAGCLGALVVMNAVDGVSALLIVTALGGVAGLAFYFAASEREIKSVSLPAWLRFLSRPLRLAVALFFLAAGNAAVYPSGLALSFSKEQVEIPHKADHIEWNSYSRIRAEKPLRSLPKLWAASPKRPPVEIEQRLLKIDGGAGTTMYRFTGNLDEMAFLKYDLTNLAYYIRNSGRAAIIGVGGGRDMLAAYLFGFRDVTGIEINPIFIKLLARRFRDFNRLADLPGIRFEVDEARSWFARNSSAGQFDLIQMSLIDTWAATSIGAFSLSENGLYTVQGWKHFLNSLAPNGVFTVSRWYSPENASETGRLMSLAKASLKSLGIKQPERHLFLASLKNLATLIVSRAPLSERDIATLRDVTQRLGFAILISPDAEPAIASLREIMAADGPEALDALSSHWHLDVTAPTDDRPFFFNQLRIADPAAMIAASKASKGVFQGNLWATFTLLTIVFLSMIFVVLTIIVPIVPSATALPSRLFAFGTIYFTAIGLAFMFVEMSVIQRLSLFLGHPVYGLSIGLFAIILSTGIGSLVSEWISISRPSRIALWCGVLAAFLVALPAILSRLSELEAEPLAIRALAAIAVTLPLGMLMGFAFPTGMRLVSRINRQPGPWFWAINGAAGVLGASVALATNITFSINVSIWAAALFYLAAGLCAVLLLMMPPVSAFKREEELASA